MISLFGVLSLVVFLLCVAGLVLHRYVMNHRTRLDAALEALDELEEPDDEDADEDKVTAAHQEYEEALAAYNACVSRFPGNIVARILQLP